VISADVDLNFHLVEANSFELSTSFYGRDSASVVCSESFDEDLLTWRLNVGASTLTDPPRESSQNSQIFFSSAQHNIALFCIPAIALCQTVIGQCTETASVTLSVSASWSITDESRSQVTVSYLGPKAYGYDLSLTIPGETVSDWSADDETLLIANLMSFYNDPILSFTLLSLTDVNGNLVIVVNVLGFSTMSSVTFSYDLILGGGLVLSDSAFSSVTSTASTPGLSCSMGFSTTSSSDVCSDTDACLTDSCSDDGDLTAVCLDAVAPEVGWSCNCTIGWEENNGTCGRVSCPNPSQAGYLFASGTSFFESTLAVSCATGYSGTASDILCQADGTWTSSTGCSPISEFCSSSPSQTGYVITFGASTISATRETMCAIGYSGSGTSITCQSSAAWSLASGCTIVSCPSSPTQTGFTIASGASTYGATRSTSCATGYTGTGSAISCQSNASWSSASGCTIVSCPSSPTQTGFTIAAGASTYGSSRTTSCASGYSGTGTAITCGASGAWSSASGCASGDKRCEIDPANTQSVASGSNTAYDLSGNGNHGAFRNRDGTQTALGGMDNMLSLVTDSITGQPVLFFVGYGGDGQGYLQWSTHPLRSASTHTVEVWWRNTMTYDAYGYNPIFYSSSSPGFQDFGLMAYDWGNSGLGLETNNEWTGSVGVSTDTYWNHIVRTFDGATHKIYRNGAEVFSGNVGNRAAIGTSHNWVGIGQFDNDNYNGCCGATQGRLGYLALFNRALSSSEVAANFAARASRFRSWTVVAEETAGSSGSDVFRQMNFGSAVPSYCASGNYQIKFEWQRYYYVVCNVPSGQNVFRQDGSNPEDVGLTNCYWQFPEFNLGTTPWFRHACKVGGTNWGDTCWGIVPSTDSNSQCGANSGGWTGTGIYYGGMTNCNVCGCWGGAFSGPKTNGQQKGGLVSLGLVISVKQN